MTFAWNDPFTLQAEARKAYLLHQQGLLTDVAFVAVIKESIRKTTSLPVGDPTG